jgi:plastocyanin
MQTLAVCAALALAGSAFAGDKKDDTSEKDEEADKTVTVEATEFKFKPDEFEVAVGSTVQFELVNKGNIAHSFEIPKFDIATDKILADKSTTVTFTPKEAGEYTFICNVPGHKQAGMKGTIRVTEK